MPLVRSYLYALKCDKCGITEVEFASPISYIDRHLYTEELPDNWVSDKDTVDDTICTSYYCPNCFDGLLRK